MRWKDGNEQSPRILYDCVVVVEAKELLFQKMSGNKRRHRRTDVKDTVR